MNSVIRVDSVDVQSSLAALGLTQAILWETIKAGHIARSNATANHPPNFGALVAWGEAVRTLRDCLVVTGWTRDNAKNSPRTVHPDGSVALVIASGNEHTGRINESPATNSPKGITTIEAIQDNRQLSLFDFNDGDLVSIKAKEDAKRVTWILLIYSCGEEIRAELSLPMDIGVDGRVTVWQERILLGSMPLDPEQLEITPAKPSDSPDIDVPIRRKA